MNRKYNTIVLGFLSGMLVPSLTFFIIFMVLSGTLSFSEYVHKLVTLNVLTKFLSLAILPNLLLFFIFIRKNLLESARGTLAATILMAFAVLLIKLLV